jgi:uncharacterized protein YbjQ (UPF0145 family)
VEFFQITFAFVLLAGAYLIGSRLERRHLADLRARERRHRHHPAMTLSTPPDGAEVLEASLVAGNVVVSLDYFKRFLAGLRAIFGGRIRAYEPLLDRARREALLRMREDAIERDFDMVINVRLETSRLASAGADGKGTAGVEILAFGTALKIAKA